MRNFTKRWYVNYIIVTIFILNFIINKPIYTSNKSKDPWFMLNLIMRWMMIYYLIIYLYIFIFISEINKNIIEIYIYFWLNTKIIRIVIIIEIMAIEIKPKIIFLHFLLGYFAICPLGWMVFYSNLVFLSYDNMSTLIFLNLLIFRV